MLAKKATIKNDANAIRRLQSQSPAASAGRRSGCSSRGSSTTTGSGRRRARAPGLGAGGPRGGPDRRTTKRALQRSRSPVHEDRLKELESAKLAENIIPKRMVVVNGAIPYKKQVEAYAAALKARSPADLAPADLPLYRGYNVQRAS